MVNRSSPLFSITCRSLFFAVYDGFVQAAELPESASAAAPAVGAHGQPNHTGSCAACSDEGAHMATRSQNPYPQNLSPVSSSSILYSVSETAAGRQTDAESVECIPSAAPQSPGRSSFCPLANMRTTVV